MHIEILVEDASGGKLLEILLPKLPGSDGHPHTWKIHAYKGIGYIPKGLKAGTDPAKRLLLDRLPRILAGYGKTPDGLSQAGSNANGPKKSAHSWSLIAIFHPVSANCVMACAV